MNLIKRVLLAGLAASLLTGIAFAQAPPIPPRPKTVYQLSCLVCGNVPRGMGYNRRRNAFGLSLSPTDPMEPVWTVSISGGLSVLSNVGTNNGFMTSAALRLAQHWNLRTDIFSVATPSTIVVLAGPEYMWSLAHWIPPNDYFNTANIQPFLNLKLGDEKSNGASKFAYAVGGGFSVIVSPTMTLRPLDVSYVRSSVFGPKGTFIGNHLQYAASIGLNF
jgi:hypothetical protein